MTQERSELPWTKREIIDAVIGQYTPGGDFQSGGTMTSLRTFVVLALGRPEGRAAPYIEHALWQRLRRVFRALRDGRDPNAAYEMPLDDEQPLTADDQLDAMMAPSSRQLAKLIDEMDHELRAKRTGGT